MAKFFVGVLITQNASKYHIFNPPQTPPQPSPTPHPPRRLRRFHSIHAEILGTPLTVIIWFWLIKITWKLSYGLRYWVAKKHRSAKFKDHLEIPGGRGNGIENTRLRTVSLRQHGFLVLSSHCVSINQSINQSVYFRHNRPIEVLKTIQETR